MGMAATCALSACTDNRSGNTAPVNSVTATFLFYRNSLNAVDPANPTVPIAIEPLGTIGNVTAIEHAMYQPAPLYFLYNRHYNTIVYRKTTTALCGKSAP